MTVRAKLLITIGILYVAAVVGIGVYAVRSSYEVGGRAASDAQPAAPSECILWNTVRTLESGFEARGLPIYDSQADAEEAARRDRALGWQVKIECATMSIARDRVPARAAVPPDTRYESETIVTGLVASTLAMAIAVGGVLVWSRPTSAADAQVSGSPQSDAEGSPPRDMAYGIESSEAVDESAPSTSTTTARIAESLRQLKTLHDEGILTDVEYETKRKALTDQL